MSILIGGDSIVVIRMIGLWVVGSGDFGEGLERSWECDGFLGVFLPPYETAATSSLRFLINPEDPGDADTRAIFPDFRPSSIVSPTLTISANLAPTSNMIRS